jgi:SAM-dependent methyltransferase
VKQTRDDGFEIPPRTPPIESELYAAPRVVDDLEECWFYHTMDVPGHGTVHGHWDLRRTVGTYLGNVDFAGKRVLDVGCASGFLSLHVEREGAQVVSYDLSDQHPWDIVPFAATDYRRLIEERKAGIRKLNNSYWLNHRLNASRARVVYGTVYQIPLAIGTVDVSVLGSILLHLRDPFQALYSAARLTRTTIVVADVLSRRDHLQSLWGLLRRPTMTFLPDGRTGRPDDAWWLLTPEAVVRFLSALGFGKARLSYHRQPYKGQQRRLFTVVAERTSGSPETDTSSS